MKVRSASDTTRKDSIEVGNWVLIRLQGGDYVRVNRQIMMNARMRICSGFFPDLLCVFTAYQNSALDVGWKLVVALLMFKKLDNKHINTKEKGRKSV